MIKVCTMQNAKHDRHSTCATENQTSGVDICFVLICERKGENGLSNIKVDIF